jgi:hypothetical protein
MLLVLIRPGTNMAISTESKFDRPPEHFFVLVGNVNRTNGNIG